MMERQRVDYHKQLGRKNERINFLEEQMRILHEEKVKFEFLFLFIEWGGIEVHLCTLYLLWPCHNYLCTCGFAA